MAQLTSVELTDEDRVDTAVQRAGVPERFQASTLEHFQKRPGTEQALDAVRRYLDVDDNVFGLILLGKPGTGKTHLAVSVLREQVRQNISRDPELRRWQSKFVVVPELLDQLRERINDPRIPDPLPALMTAPLLVLDDLGREKASEWVADRLYVLVNHRYNADLVTIVTSNSELSELASRGYEAMISRLREDAKVVKITAPDHRQAR